MKHTPEPTINRIRAAVEMIEQGKDWYMEEIDALRYDLAKSMEREADLWDALRVARKYLLDGQVELRAHISDAIKKAEGET